MTETGGDHRFSYCDRELPFPAAVAWHESLHEENAWEEAHQ